MERIQELRTKITSLSQTITALLLQRRKLSLRIQKLKQEQGLPAFDQRREAELLKLLTEGLDESENKYIEKIFQQIFYQSRS